MRSRVLNLRIIVVIALTLTICVGSTEGLTNHGFYWGIEIGDRFDYHMAHRFPDSSKNKALDYYVVVDELPSIDENITDIPQITTDRIDWNNFHSFYFMNDTMITSQTISDELCLGPLFQLVTGALSMIYSSHRQITACLKSRHLTLQLSGGLVSLVSVSEVQSQKL